MEQIRFDDQVAIITGAGRGIGVAHAEFLGSRGAKLIINDLNGIEAVVEDLKSKGFEVEGINGDISKTEDAEKIVKKAIDTYGHLEILVNNAGVNRAQPIDEESDELFDFIQGVNVRGTRNLCKAVYPIFKEQKYGRIINTTSAAGMYGMGDIFAYATSKGAIYGMTRCLADAGEKYNIKVNAIAPMAATVMSVVESNIPADVAEVFAKSSPVEAIPPVLGILAAKDCPVTGKIFETGSGRVNEIFVGTTCGYYDPTFSAEILKDHFADLVDREDYGVLKNGNEASDFLKKSIERQFAKQAQQ